MKVIKIFYFLFFIAVLNIPQSAFATPIGGQAQDYNTENIFYLPAYNAVKGVESLEKNWEQIDILAPQYHTLTEKFNVTGIFGPKLTKVIKEKNLRVMPLIANAGFSQKLMHNFLLSKTAQDKVINYIIKGALTNGYIGWQYDFENISYKDRDLYSAFIERSYKAFKKNNLILSVAVISRTTDYADTNAFKNWGGVFDYKLIAENSDFISLMAYDDPNSVGPVASIDFVNKALAYLKDKVPPEKLSLGVPLYYWKWNIDTNKKVGVGLFKNVLTIIANYKHTLDFNESLGVSCLTYAYGKKNYKIWFEDKNSLDAKLDIIKDNNLRGFSAWLLGGEDPEIWNMLAKS
jgi:spore germination protein YaaH